MSEKYLLFSLDDEKSKKLGEVISNPTCKKIVNLLSEKDLSEADIAHELNIPINTAEYNLKKLLEAGIIEKKKEFFWSRKGRKIDMYKVANKLIVISPKKSSGVYSKLKSIVPVALVSGILTGFIAWYYKTGETASIAVQKTADFGGENLAEVSNAAASASALPTANIPQIQSLNSSLSWEWFLVGSLLTIMIFLIWNWKKL
jgi:predicted transcriptional regulator